MQNHTTATYNTVDYIIVGLGLAGTCLTLQLYKRGKKVAVFDSPHHHQASSVAAGLFNPITGRNMVKTWMADKLFPYLHTFYTEAEQILQCRFFYPLSLYKPFLNVEEQNDWFLKKETPELSSYLTCLYNQSTYGHQINDPLGGIILSHCGYVSTNNLIRGVKKLLIEQSQYYNEVLCEKALSTTEKEVRYKNISAKKIIFCTGIHAISSAYFPYVPLVPLKGEIIYGKTNESLAHIYNRSIYAIGTVKRNCVIGATYDVGNATVGVTKQGRDRLTNKAKKLFKIPLTITGGAWGIRPATVHRKPLIGRHPLLKNVFFFNGLGSKGVSLAPWFSNQLADHLCCDHPIHADVGISRYYKNTP